MTGYSISILLCVFFVALISPLSGVAGEAWDFDRLWKEAELVVVAEALSPDVVPSGNLLPEDQIQMEVEIRIESVLKGAIDKARRHTLTYVRRETSANVIGNFSDLVEFPKLTKQELARLDRLATPRVTYLMFLKRGKDGNLRVVSGDLNSAKSVSRLSTFADNPRAFEVKEGLPN